MTFNYDSINSLLARLADKINRSEVSIVRKRSKFDEKDISQLDKKDEKEIIQSYDYFCEDFIKTSFREIKTSITNDTSLPSQITNPSLYIFIPTILNNPQLIYGKNLSKPQQNILINTIINNSEDLNNLSIKSPKE